MRRLLMWLELCAAIALLVYGTYIVWQEFHHAHSDPRDEGMLVIIFGGMIFGYGLSFLIAALGLRGGGRIGWWLQLCPAVPTVWIFWDIFSHPKIIA